MERGLEGSGLIISFAYDLVEMHKTATAGILHHRERIVGGLDRNRNCKSWQVSVSLGRPARDMKL